VCARAFSFVAQYLFAFTAVLTGAINRRGQTLRSNLRPCAYRDLVDDRLDNVLLREYKTVISSVRTGVFPQYRLTADV
jgi:hypothetical protein